MEPSEGGAGCLPSLRFAGILALRAASLARVVVFVLRTTVSLYYPFVLSLSKHEDSSTAFLKLLLWTSGPDPAKGGAVHLWKPPPAVPPAGPTDRDTPWVGLR